MGIPRKPINHQRTMSRTARPLTMKTEQTGEGTGPTKEGEIPAFGILEAGA